MSWTMQSPTAATTSQTSAMRTGTSIDIRIARTPNGGRCGGAPAATRASPARCTRHAARFTASMGTVTTEVKSPAMAPDTDGPTPSDCSTSNEVNMMTPVDMLATAAGKTSAVDASGEALSSFVKSRNVCECGYLARSVSMMPMPACVGRNHRSGFRKRFPSARDSGTDSVRVAPAAPPAASGTQGSTESESVDDDEEHGSPAVIAAATGGALTVDGALAPMSAGGASSAAPSSCLCNRRVCSDGALSQTTRSSGDVCRQ
jgi:hypothetical protein